jgi:NTP pyrophosphatase (non-canonical NTP hydrolase)
LGEIIYNTQVDWVALGVTKMSVDINAVVQDILEEVERAEEKFPRWPVDPIHALAIIQEEVGELTKAVFEASYGTPGFDEFAHIDDEAIQVAASILMFLKHTDKYEYKPSEQTSL